MQEAAGRVGIGLTYAFRLDGSPRGGIAFAPFVPGFARNPFFVNRGGRRDAPSGGRWKTGD